MALSQVRKKGQVTIPTEIREAAGIEEGTVLEFELSEEGIVMRPKEMIDADQAWFWKRGWQEGELEASAEHAAGKGKVYKSEEAFLAALKRNQRSTVSSKKGSRRR
jgi:AbrB family looped-hinge helix DNA binding protein